MKRVLIVFLLLIIGIAATSQPKTRGKVKRKYRKVEQVNETLPQVVFRGIVRDVNKVPLPGVSIEIEGMNRLVHSNEYGQFMLSELPTGRLRLKFYCLGYRTKTIDYALKAGFNDHYVALDQERVHPEPVVVTVQKREQHIQDVPAAVTGITHSFAEQLSLHGYKELAAYFPNLSFEDLGAGSTGFSMGGGAAYAGFPMIPSSVALFTNEVPVVQPEGLSSLVYDVDRIEVLSGPQNVLFGRNALKGAIHVVSRKPVWNQEGYIAAAGGNFWSREVRVAINLPLVRNTLAVRAAGMYTGNMGYIENPYGNMLNGENNFGGRFSVRYVPAFNHKLDVVVNYSKHDYSGTAFMNAWMINENVATGLMDYQASFNGGIEPGSASEAMDASINYRYFINEHDYLTFIGSYRKGRNRGKTDADGTSLSAFELDDEADSRLKHYEFRYNFSNKSRSNGSAGISYSQNTGNLMYNISSNDNLIYEILAAPGNFVMPEDNRFPVNTGPFDSNPLIYFSFPGDHQEVMLQETDNHLAQAYVQLTYHLRQRWFVHLGSRAIYDRMELAQTTVFSGGAESSLGTFSSSYPNLLFLPAAQQEIQANRLSLTGQAGLIYRRHEKFNLFVNATVGRKPEALFFTWDSRPLVSDAERVYSLDGGWKAIVKDLVFWDLTGYYRRHLNVQAIQWGGAPGSGLLFSNGKAGSYGLETGLKASFTEGVELFGRYAWMQSVFDSTGVDGKEYIYAGNSFPRAPEHSFTAGINLSVNLLSGLKFTAAPWYAWQSHFWFTESNAAGLDQPAYGLLNVRLGLEMSEPDLIIGIYGYNLLDEKYISSVGHWGGILGLPTVVPGAPRMLGAKITWAF